MPSSGAWWPPPRPSACDPQGRGVGEPGRGLRARPRGDGRRRRPGHGAGRRRARSSGAVSRFAGIRPGPGRRVDGRLLGRARSARRRAAAGLGGPGRQRRGHRGASRPAAVVAPTPPGRGRRGRRLRLAAGHHRGGHQRAVPAGVRREPPGASGGRVVRGAGLPPSAAQRAAMRARLRSGAHLPHPGITVRRARGVVVRSSRPFPVEVDGRKAAVEGAREVAVSVVPAAFRLLV